MRHNGKNSSVNISHIVKMLFPVCLLFTLLSVLFFVDIPQAKADTEVGGSITSDTTWTQANSPYIVASESVTVTQGITLTIDPGVTVRFNPGLILWVNGTLVARGTASNPITFTSNQSNPAPGDWGNIDFRGTNVNTIVDDVGNYKSGSILQHCVIKNGGWDGVQPQNAIYAFGTSLMVDNCLIENNNGSGIMIYRYDSNYLSWVTNNTIRNNVSWGLGGGIILRAGVIKNNIITNNNARNGVDGGGIYAINSDIIGNIVTENTTKATGGTAGGGIYVEADGSSTILIEGNVVKDNYDVNYGGGIYIKTGTADPEFIVKENLISRNTALTDGGGIYVNGQSGLVTIQDNAIIYNTAESEINIFGGGGGIFIAATAPGPEVIIKKNLVSGNTSYQNGGGLNISGEKGSVTVQGNVLSGNMADSNTDNDGSGGGIYCDFKNGSHTLMDNVIADNFAGERGGGIYTDYCGITGNLISNNQAVEAGGGIVSSGDILSNTISANSVISATGMGAGVFLEGNGDFLYNSLIDNTGEPGSLMGGLHITGTPEVHHNNIYGNFPYNVVVSSSKTISGTLNYWGTDLEPDIQESIYDHHDVASLGEFIYDPYLPEQEILVPLFPPYSLTATLNEDQVMLVWEDPNQNFSEGWGYYVYYDIDSHMPPYEGVGLNEGNSPIDVGDQKTATLSGLEPYTDYYIAVTVYDDIGRESEYAIIVLEQPETETASPVFFLPLISR